MISWDWKQAAREVFPEVMQLRRTIHKDPELGNKEFHTAALVENYLHGCGIETKRMTDTAVMGILRGGRPGKVAALRADMDALPVTEATNAEFASQNSGVMHACGHDIHTAALLGAAKLLSLRKEELCGTVKFFFQPDEEGGVGGAKPMMDAGCMEQPPVEAVFGAHVAPDLPYGTIGVREGQFYAASDFFTIEVFGKSAHGAKPEKAIDALKAAAELVLLLQQIPQQLPQERTIVTVGTMQAGTVRNIIAGSAKLEGIIRTLSLQMRKRVKQMISEAAADIERKHGVKVVVDLLESHPGITNTKSVTDHVRKTLKDHGFIVEEILGPSMISEDFGYYLEKAPGSFYHFGTGGDSELHSNTFLPKDELLIIGAAAHAAVVWEYLEQGL